jgi:nucleotide-binding universal stress UspA family protein
MTRVMIAVDGSDLDSVLAAEAHRLFGDDAEYWAVNVHNPDVAETAIATAPPVFGGAAMAFGAAYPYVPTYPRADAGAATPDGEVGTESEGSDVAAAAAEQAGLADAKVVSEAGDPGEAILRAAERHRADVVVVGSRDRSWWSRLIDRSVSGDIVEESAIPVLLVRERR